MIDAALLELFSATVTIAAPGTRALDGASSPGTATPYQAKVEPGIKMIRNQRGEEVVSMGRVFLIDHYPAITPRHRLTLPDGSTPPIITIETTYDERGPYQTVLHY